MRKRNDSSPHRDVSRPFASGAASLPAGFEQQASAALLSAAEREVCRLVVCGWSNKDIARLRRRSPATIKNQVASILAKFGLPNRCHLLAHLR